MLTAEFGRFVSFWQAMLAWKQSSRDLALAQFVNLQLIYCAFWRSARRRLRGADVCERALRACVCRRKSLRSPLVEHIISLSAQCRASGNTVAPRSNAMSASKIASNRNKLPLRMANEASARRIAISINSHEIIFHFYSLVY